MISEKNTKPELLAEYKKLMAQAKADKKSVSSIRSMSAKNNKTDILAEIQKLQDIVSGKTGTPAKQSEPVREIVTQKPDEPENKPVRKPAEKPVKNAKHPETTRKHPEEENDLSYLNQEIIEEINALTTVKTMKEDEYQMLCTAEEELRKFASMINQFKNDLAKQETSQTEEVKAQKERLDELTTQAQERNALRIEEAEKSLQDAQEAIEADKKKIADERAVEEEKYNYEKTRKYLEEDDKWADEVALREEKIQNIRKETTELQAKIDEKADHVKELTAKIEEIPELLEAAKQEAAEAREKELNKEHGYCKHMAQKDADAAIQSLERQIANIKADYETALVEKNAIQDKLDKAYEESNKLYMQTVQSTGGIKILNNSDKN